ncbi:MAG: molecular chaperone DnaJ [bacterium]
MAIKRDYYEILGVKKDATAAQIKQAYRKLAMQYHPDRVAPDKKKESEEKFKEISEAYAVLTDTQKKSQYDQFGHAGIDGRYSSEDIFRTTDFGSVFEEFGFGKGIFGDLFGGGRAATKRGPTRGADLEYVLPITLEEAYKGVEKTINIYHTVICNLCKGQGAKPGTRKKTCAKCKGSGHMRYTQGFLSFAQPCQACNGQGETIESPCPECQGRGKVRKNSHITIKIPPGVNTGNSIRMREKGEAGELGGPSGDLYVVVKMKPHPVFERDGDDIYCNIPISFAIATLGGEVHAPTLESKVKMKIPPGTQTNKTFRLSTKGIPNVHGRGRGDEFVTVIVEVPKKVSKKEADLVKQLSLLEGETLGDDGFLKNMFK